MSRIPFSKVNKGTPDGVHATEFNSFLETSEKFKAGQFNTTPGDTSSNTHDGEIVLVRSRESSSVDQYNYMVIVGLVIDPSQFEDSFLEEPVFEVETYDQANSAHENAAIVILQELIGSFDDTLKRAKIKGSTQVRVDIKNEKHNAFKRVSGSTILESSTGGVVANISKEIGDGERWAYGEIMSLKTKKQFKVISLVDDNVIDCLEFTDGVEGVSVIRIAMPYMIQRTPFDGFKDTFENLIKKQRDKLLRYEYSSVSERKCFAKDADEFEEAEIAIETAQTQVKVAKKDLQDAIAGGNPEEIEEAEITLEEAELAVVSAIEALDGLPEEEEDQTIIPRYLPGDIINADILVQGGITTLGTELKNIFNDPVLWIDDNNTARFWMDNPDFTEEEVEEE